MKSIDLNCDMGESFGNYTVGQDELLMPYLTSCNIACGFHGGDPYHIERTIDHALAHGLRIGAHPSYPDLQGFGRRKMMVPPSELSSLIKYQVGAIKAMVESKGGNLSYVKPHGALYNSLAHDTNEAEVVIRAVKEIDSTLKIMLLAGSPAIDVAKEHGINVIQEAFADRRYVSSTALMSRSISGSVIADVASAVHQVLSIVERKRIKCSDDIEYPLHAESICIHGDHTNAVVIAQGVHEELSRRNLLQK